jgi:hypothetical protein
MTVFISELGLQWLPAAAGSIGYPWWWRQAQRQQLHQQQQAQQ